MPLVSAENAFFAALAWLAIMGIVAVNGAVIWAQFADAVPEPILPLLF